MEVLALGVLTGTAILAAKILDWVKLLQAGAMKDWITQTAAFIVGVLVTFLAAATDFADGLAVNDITFGKLNSASLIYLGLMLGATGSYLYDRSPRNTPSLGERIPD